MSSNSANKTVSLVLGSGGARGLAHIGVIRELEDMGYEIASIAGCSIGALIGGVYAADKLDDYESWVSEITKLDIFNLLDLSWGKRGLIKGDKIINTLVDMVGDCNIEDLPIAYTAVATDIGSGREIWIRSDRLFDAIRASISLPLFFTPFEYRGMHLIDGGVVNPVPIAPTFSDHTDLTIAVNLGGAPTETISPAPKSSSAKRQGSTVKKWISNLVDELRDNDGDGSEEDWDAYDVANQAFDAMQETIARQKLAAYPPDVVVEIPRNACGILEFDRASELIELGRNKLREKLSDDSRESDGSHEAANRDNA